MDHVVDVWTWNVDWIDLMDMVNDWNVLMI